ncbi:flagellar export protein FliJ [Halothermothrix orenii]|uniref:Flagellar FliJ protein n=1 Tax=Halothermothrix orenii (strain H 168 / OCM 544 / DSM 9562) TaxID=373903 RepID=B8CYR6_HALOH|nr:flagellar export protein FliJ [Halothermothrix orenii]ACL70435.1 flagellar export protein FliJ [Halothermothrix orenii H 168]
MKKFEFNLQKVLEVRSLEEDLARNKLLAARQKEREIQSRLREMNSTQRELYDYLRENNLDIQGTIEARKYLVYNRKRINNTEDKLHRQRDVVARHQKEYIDRRKNKKVLEKLKEKENQKYMKEFFRTEQKILDEIGQRSSGIQGD